MDPAQVNAILFHLIYNGNLVELYRFLHENNANPVGPTDNKQSSALHIATFINATATARFLLSYIANTYPETAESLTRDWVNAANAEGYTPLLYAVHVGNMVITQTGPSAVVP